MKNKRLIIILVLLIMVLFIAITIFSILITPNNEVDTQKNQYKDENYGIKYENLGKYEPSIINKEYSSLNVEEINMIDNTIDNILSLLNNKEYDKLYDMLAQDYKIIRFQTLVQFEEYLNENFKQNNYKCLSYRIKEDNLYMNVSEYENGIDLKEIKINYFADQSNMHIYFEDIKDIEKIQTSFKIEGLLFNIEYIIEYEDKLSVLCDVRNTKNNSVEFEIENLNLITIINGAEYNNISESFEKISMQANDKKAIEIYFNNNDLTYLPDYLEANLVINGENETINKSFVKPELN